MNLMGLISNIPALIVNAVITLIALTGHELGHAWVSTKLGDPTPRMEGRLTINPLAHLDIVGTILMILTGFGWAKPVGINPAYYKDRKKGTALTAAAGPLSNLIMSFAVLLLYYIYAVIAIKTGFAIGSIALISSLVSTFVVRNLCFMVFNLIPIPPLDGSKVLGIFLPDRYYYTMLRYERYCMILIMVLSLMGVFGNVIGTGVNIIFSALTGMLDHVFNLVI